MQELRESIIPTANRYSVEQLGLGLTSYQESTKKKVQCNLAQSRSVRTMAWALRAATRCTLVASTT